MRYAEYAPAPELRPYVDRYWSLVDDAPAADPHLILPDGHPEWVIHFGVPFAGQSGCLYIGQMTAPVQLRAGGRVSAFGVRFRPEGAWAFTGVSQETFRDRICRLDEILPSAGQWQEEAGNGDSVRATDRYLSALVRAASNDERVRGAVGRLLTGSRMDETAAGSGWSVRQLERVVRERTGLSPKTLARLSRFHRALRARDRGGAWVEIAVECGYSDQSHLIRDFRQFAGSAPSLVQPTDLTNAMIR